MKVSVITAAYNRPRSLLRTIQSVRAQSLEDWEHIIIDDGSSEDLWPTIAAKVRRDPRITYVRRANGGQASALNLGITMARAPFVAFLDDDDEYTEHHLRLRLACFAKRPNVDLVWGGLKTVGPKALQYVDDVERLGKRIHFSDCRVLGTIVARRALLRRVRGLRHLTSLDYDLCKRIEAAGGVTHQVRHPTLVYNVGGRDRISLRSASVDGAGRLQAAPRT